MKDGDPAICARCGFVDQSSGSDPGIRAIYPDEPEVVSGKRRPTRCQHMFNQLPARTWCGAGKHRGCPCASSDTFFQGGSCVCMCHHEVSPETLAEIVDALHRMQDLLIPDTAIVSTYFGGLTVTLDPGVFDGFIA